MRGYARMLFHRLVRRMLSSGVARLQYVRFGGDAVILQPEPRGNEGGSMGVYRALLSKSCQELLVKQHTDALLHVLKRGFF